jgi:hypothetical protein
VAASSPDEHAGDELSDRATPLSGTQLDSMKLTVTPQLCPGWTYALAFRTPTLVRDGDLRHLNDATWVAATAHGAAISRSSPTLTCDT